MTGNSTIQKLAKCDTPQEEYWTHVSAQGELPMADGNLPSILRGELDDLANVYETSGDEAFFGMLSHHLRHTPVLIEQLRLLVAISDKRLYLDLSYIFSRLANPIDGSLTLCGCRPDGLTRHSTAFFIAMLENQRRPEIADAATQAIAHYLVNRGLGDVFDLYSNLDWKQREILLTNLVFPKEFQQNEAKRRGHGVEVLMASVLEFVGVNFLPRDKVTNPMGSRDPNVDLESMRIVDRQAETFSCDLVVVDQDLRTRACFQGLVQSSDPGQFGVEKATTTVLARSRFDVFNEGKSLGEQVQLWGILDGVGYSENKTGTINRLLEAFHDFFQVKSAFKLPLALMRLGLCEVSGIRFDADFYGETASGAMADRYVPAAVQILQRGDEDLPECRIFEAGKAVLYLPRSASTVDRT